MCGIREVSRSSMVDPAERPGRGAGGHCGRPALRPPALRAAIPQTPGRAELPGAGPPAPQGKPTA